MYDHQLEAPTIHESIYIHECLLGVLGEGLQHIAGAPRSTCFSLCWRTNLPSVFHEEPSSRGLYRVPCAACASTTWRTVRLSPIRGSGHDIEVPGLQQAHQEGALTNEIEKYRHTDRPICGGNWDVFILTT